MTDLTSMKNIGAEMARKLKAVGIDSPETLGKEGAKQAFFKLKTLYPHVCLVHLYALEGAVRDMDFNCLPQEVKEDLKAFSNALKNGGSGR